MGGDIIKDRAKTKLHHDDRSYKLKLKTIQSRINEGDTW
jgi:hypothetical protein